MEKELRIDWKMGARLTVIAFNKKGEKLGILHKENVGQFQHWCWYQEEGISMSPGCLDEVRAVQKRLGAKKYARKKKT